MALATLLFHTYCKCTIQNQPVSTGPISTKEMQRLSKMSPAELAKYQQEMVRKLEKQAQAAATAGNLLLDESLLQSSSLKLPILARSVDAEIKFWSVAGIPSAAEQQKEGRKLPGIYSDLVTELMSDLDNTYIPNLQLFTEADHAQLLQLNSEFVQKLQEVQCPPFPTGNNVTAEVIMAYERKCCDKKKPIIDQFLRQYNDVVRNRFGIVQPRWKTYLNAAINIVQLDPTSGNRHTVYARVAQYFVFLQQAAVAGRFHLSPSECHVPMTTAQADSILLQAKHELDFNCPEWLKLDCESFSI
jgi:hypothetical protein